MNARQPGRGWAPQFPLEAPNGDHIAKGHVNELHEWNSRTKLGARAFTLSRSTQTQSVPDTEPPFAGGRTTLRIVFDNLQKLSGVGIVAAVASHGLGKTAGESGLQNSAQSVGSLPRQSQIRANSRSIRC